MAALFHVISPVILLAILQCIRLLSTTAASCCSKCTIRRTSISDPDNILVNVTERTDGHLDVYKRWKQCDWLLTAPDGYSTNLVKINRYLDLYYNEPLLAYDGVTPSSSSKTLSKHSSDLTMTSSGRNIWLKYVITGRIQTRFTLEYSVLKQQKVSQCLGVKIQNARLNCSVYTCHVSCNPGYFIFGSTKLTCVDGNQWAGLLPKCLSVKVVGTTKNDSMGRVEVFVDGQWYAVSYSRGWTIQSANIVCRMLGLPNATAAPEGSIFPSTTRYTLMQVEGCTGHRLLEFLRYCYNKDGNSGVVCGLPTGFQKTFVI
ncbi:deleted in malignant brain tumors 1 protein-like [Actinia tenebrosa]|uniref:Deleted in malignant brain tumors 1 protein-like n=1 Tax=Actinia tenebrosa TaxID=6105 RepID=A0A6P8I839_ACTTE|nr:deleted in malignant brain tumors 1 protein-like [Actinia tenebrosa]